MFPDLWRADSCWWCSLTSKAFMFLAVTFLLMQGNPTDAAYQDGGLMDTELLTRWQPRFLDDQDFRQRGEIGFRERLFSGSIPAYLGRHSIQSRSGLIPFPRVGRSAGTWDVDSEATGKSRKKRQALIPFPRTGKRSSGQLGLEAPIDRAIYPSDYFYPLGNNPFLDNYYRDLSKAGPKHPAVGFNNGPKGLNGGGGNELEESLLRFTKEDKTMEDDSKFFY